MSAPAGEQLAARAERLSRGLPERGVDALLVEALVDVRYLSGFTGSSGAVLVIAPDLAAQLGGHRFVTDFRYTTQAGAQVPDAYKREIAGGDLLESVASLLHDGGGRLGFDEAHTTVKTRARLAELLGENWDLIGCAGAVGELRAVKEASEIALIRAACELADAAMREVLEGGLAGRSERDVALALQLSMLGLGAEALSFPSIVASGAHGALPHAEPRAETIARDVLVTIDWGAVHEGYYSDCTRTYATGEGISAQAREVYALVLDAQQQGLAAVRAGRGGRAVDAVARAVIERAGHAEHFGHGLGHGVGMEIHEPPRLSRTAPESPLVAGNVVTVEPGVYLPGELGVRIEDLVVVVDSGAEVLTSISKELTVVS